MRAIIPFVAGMARMDTRSFFLWNIISAFAWAVTHLLLGYFFGHAWRAVETWSTRISLVIISLVLFIMIVYWLKSLLFRRGKQLFALVSSILFSIKQAIITNPEVQQLVSRHPRFFQFLHARLRTDRFSGISLSLLGVAFLVTLALLLGVVEDLLRSEPIVAVDVRLHTLLYALRNPVLVKYFLWITLLGKAVIVVSVALVVGIILWLSRKRVYMLPFWLGLIGSSLFDALGKLAFHRPRPEFAVYPEYGFSFPSGHATIAVACYGFITYVLWKHLDSWKHKLNVLFAGIGIILAIGLSRIYLGVHFLSDVWGGYLLGSLWLIIGISLVEWRLRQTCEVRLPPYSPPRRVKMLTTVLILAELGFYGAFAGQYHPPRSIQAETDPQTVMIANIADILVDRRFPRYTEKLTGDRQEPLSFLVIASDDAQLISAFRQAGWSLADNLSLTSLFKAAKADFLNIEDLTAPLVPYFWNVQVHDFGFQKPTAAQTVRQRHHARFWITRYQTADGRRLYVGTASLDVGMKWIVHKISPDLDAEREVLFADFQKAGLVDSFQKVQFVEPTQGKNFLGELFFTNGMLYVVTLK